MRTIPKIKFERTSTILALILLLGFFLRLYKLGFQSFWLDEYFNIALVLKAKSFWDGFDFLPPLYLIILQGWLKIFPLSEVTARLPGALIGFFSLFLFYFLAKELFNKKTALWAVFFLAISVTHINYCQEAKHYSLMLTMAMLMQLTYLRVLRHREKKDFLLYGLSSVLGLYTFYYLAILFVVQLAHLFTNSRRDYALLKKVSLRQFIAVLLLLAYIMPLLIEPHLATDSVKWLKTPRPRSALNVAVAMIGGLLEGGLKMDETVFSSFLLNIKLIHLWWLGIVCLVLAIGLCWRSWKADDRQKSDILLAILWFMIPIAVFYIFSLLVFPLFHIRYILVAILGLFLIFAWVAVNEKNILLRNLFISLYVLLNISMAFYYFHHPVRMQFREAAEVLSKNIAKNETILVKGYRYEGELMGYYLGRHGWHNPITFNERKSDFDSKNYDWVVIVHPSPGDVKEKMILVREFFRINIYHTDRNAN